MVAGSLGAEDTLVVLHSLYLAVYPCLTAHRFSDVSSNTMSVMTQCSQDRCVAARSSRVRHGDDA